MWPGPTRPRRLEKETIMQLGRLGVWYSMDKLGSAQQIKIFVATVERLGYDVLWYPESRGYESFSVAAIHRWWRASVATHTKSRSPRCAPISTASARTSRVHRTGRSRSPHSGR